MDPNIRKEGEHLLAQVKDYQAKLAEPNRPRVKAENKSRPDTSPIDNVRLSDFGFDHKAIEDLWLSARARETKATLATTGAPQSLIGDFKTEPFTFGREKVRIADLIPSTTTEAGRVLYYRATTAAAAAAAVAEGTAKPESSPVWAEVEAAVVKIAHYVRVNDEVLADFRDFYRVLTTELIAGLIDAENTQIISGSGTAPNMRGLLNTVGILTRARGADTNLDALLKATTDLRVGSAFVEADVVILHPSNYESIRLLKDAQGAYLLGSPLTAGPPVLHDAKVVITTSMTANTALVANLKEAAALFVRQGPSVQVAQFGGGTVEFIANQTLARAEERLALATPRPTAMVKVTGLS